MTCALCRIPQGADPSLRISPYSRSASAFLPSLKAASPKISLAENRHSPVPERKAARLETATIAFLVERQSRDLNLRKVAYALRRGSVGRHAPIILQRRIELPLCNRFRRRVQARQNAIGAGAGARERRQRALQLILIASLDQGDGGGQRVAASRGVGGANRLPIFIAAHDGQNDESPDNKINAVSLEELGCLLATVLFVDLADEAFLVAHGATALDLDHSVLQQMGRARYKERQFDRNSTPLRRSYAQGINRPANSPTESHTHLGFVLDIS